MKISARGFTLVELLVVVSIVTVLSVVGFVSFQAVRNSTLEAKRKADIDAIKKAYEANYSPTLNNGQGGYKPLADAMFAGGKIPTPDNTSNTSYIVVGPDSKASYDNTQGSGDTAYGDNYSVCAPVGSNIRSNYCINAQDSTNCPCKTSTGGSGAPADIYPVFQNITLPAGNNFIGLKVEKGSNYTISRFYQDLGGNSNIQSIRYLNSSGTIITLGCTTGACSNSNIPISLGEAYFVNVLTRSTVNISGGRPVQNSLILRAGTNWVSFVNVPSSIDRAQKLYDSLLSAGAGSVAITRLLDGRWNTFMPGSSENFVINPGEGYRINVTNGLTYTIPSN